MDTNPFETTRNYIPIKNHRLSYNRTDGEKFFQVKKYSLPPASMMEF